MEAACNAAAGQESRAGPAGFRLNDFPAAANAGVWRVRAARLLSTSVPCVYEDASVDPARRRNLRGRPFRSKNNPASSSIGGAVTI
jgi:hypothetical protein